MAQIQGKSAEDTKVGETAMFFNGTLDLCDLALTSLALSRASVAEKS